MIAAKVLSAILIFGTLKDASCWRNGWGREIGRVWRDWHEQHVFVKRCSLYEMLGFCPSNDPTICILSHPLVTGKECAHCSDTIWFAYRKGICPGDELSELAKETGNHYYRHHHHRHHESEREKEHEKERELQEREEELQEELEYPAGEIFESGSGEVSGESTETSFTPYSAETQIEANENEGSYDAEETSGKSESKESLINRIKSFIDNVGDIFS